jgi:hypothetical protein
MNNVKQFKKYYHGMSVTPPPPTPHPPSTQLLSTTLYIYFVENWDALNINNYLINPIIIYDNRLFEK